MKKGRRYILITVAGSLAIVLLIAVLIPNLNKQFLADIRGKFASK